MTDVSVEEWHRTGMEKEMNSARQVYEGLTEEEQFDLDLE